MAAVCARFLLVPTYQTRVCHTVEDNNMNLSSLPCRSQMSHSCRFCPWGLSILKFTDIFSLTCSNSKFTGGKKIQLFRKCENICLSNYLSRIVFILKRKTLVINTYFFKYKHQDLHLEKIYYLAYCKMSPLLQICSRLSPGLKNTNNYTYLQHLEHYNQCRSMYKSIAHQHQEHYVLKHYKNRQQEYHHYKFCITSATSNNKL